MDVGEADSRVRRWRGAGILSICLIATAPEQTWQVPSCRPRPVDGNLVPRFVAEGDVDWTRPEIE
jgi:hypothetical protein